MAPPLPDPKGSFRDTVATISEDGKRNWIYPKKPKGDFYNKRTAVSIFFLILLFAGPFMKINGHPLMLFNILERKFILFGIAFWPQDFHLFVLAMLTFIVFIILFTALFGRIWCGWACPQTIFMEMVFRKIEYLIEGDYMQQKALNAESPNPIKFRKKFLKNSIFFIISFIIANTFLAYIIGVDKLFEIISEGPSQHLGGLISLSVFTLVFYGVYTKFREQACIVVCPYGRLQGVLLDKNSVVIAYDYNRGEPREKLHKGQERKAGDCIDCHQCVQVCPTGIDIRHGTQLECVNCTACIDACDSIMDKIEKPRGLIRYTSENAIAKGIKFKVTTRIIGYSIVLFILLGALITLLALRTDVEATILRTPGMLYQELPNQKVSNLYNIKVVNKTFNNLPIEIKIVEPQGTIQWVGKNFTELKEQDIAEGEFFVILDQKDIVMSKTRIKIQVISQGKILGEEESNFIGPTP
ncbi:MAG: cytochrome c oxidase accessory protein CcoG [Bacteroidia bacterium]|nr:cytochrome c oxidase accessory protein CcoG [Bacteroidota bacterium]MBP6512987.1 cytochrome c oxidase accessory protein CcoG [Bacteroidia bacterium]MBP7245020.1 cytochrome c oxidase accessory protein CcoG [Bacteroidia bacterium]